MRGRSWLGNPGDGNSVVLIGIGGCRSATNELYAGLVASDFCQDPDGEPGFACPEEAREAR